MDFSCLERKKDRLLTSPKEALEGKETDADCPGASILSFLPTETSLASFHLFHN